MRGIVFLAAMLSLPRSARANQAFATDCNFQLKDFFNPGDEVCVSGNFDKLPPQKLCPEGYIYVIPMGYSNPFADVSKGGANYVMGCSQGGAFFDAPVWLPPLAPGDYEFFIDEFPFGSMGPEDMWDGHFTVRDVPIVNTVDVMAIKAAAMGGLSNAQALTRTANYLSAINTLSTATEWGLAFGIYGGVAGLVLGIVCSDCPTSYDSEVVSIAGRILGSIADSLEKKYAGIVADPPDPKFKDLVVFDLTAAIQRGGPWSPAGAHPISGDLTRIVNLLAVQVGAYQALLPTLEKLQGAQAAKSNFGLLIQSEKAAAFIQLALSTGDLYLLALDALAADAKALGVLDVSPPAQQIKDDLERVRTMGFSASEEMVLRSFGLSTSDLATAQKSAGAMLPVPPLDLASMIATARAAHTTLVPALKDLAKQVEAIRAENAKVVVRYTPRVTLVAPATAKAGDALTLSASATHFDPKAMLVYDWDLDADGQFDDGSGTSIKFVPLHPDRHVVGVRVTDGSNHIDIANAAIDVAISNSPPEITALVPADPAPFATLGEKVQFHVVAKDADGDPISYRWLVDGMKAGSSDAFDFTMPDELPHQIRLWVADDNPTSADATVVFTVRAAKWKAVVDGGAADSGARDGSAAGGDGDGGETKDALASSDASGGDGAMVMTAPGSGCQCALGMKNASAHRSRGAGLGSLLAIGLLAWSRRRRRTGYWPARPKAHRRGGLSDKRPCPVPR